MEKWLIFCLSVMILASCMDETSSDWNELISDSIEVRKEFAEQYRKENSSFFQGSDWSQSMLDTLIMVYPEGAWPYRTKSIPFTKRGDYHISHPLLEESLARDSSESLYYYSWLTLFHYRDYDRAYELLDAYDQLTPNGRDYAMGMNVNYLKGLALRQQGKCEQAILEFDKVIREEGSVADIYNYVYRGICRYHLQEYTEAHADFDRAIQLQENCSMAHFYKALSYRRTGNIAAAIRRMEKAGEHIARGNKKNHPYYEVFDEVHLMMVRDSLAQWR